MPRYPTQICSIFGQIQGVVADALVAEGKANRIAPEDIPVTARYDEHGTRAHCALVMTRDVSAEFDRRVAALRA